MKKEKKEKKEKKKEKKKMEFFCLLKKQYHLCTKAGASRAKTGRVRQRNLERAPFSEVLKINESIIIIKYVHVFMLRGKGM